MSQTIRQLARRSAASCLAIAIGFAAVPAQAEVVITSVNRDISTTPFNFSFMGGTFTFDTSGGFPNFLNVQTGGGAAVRTVFGQPSTDFTNRRTVRFDASTFGGFAAFPDRTNVRFTNGENFLGLRVTSGGEDFFGFAFTSDTIFNSFGFETQPGVGITATRAIPAAVPEPATWAMLILGFGAVGSGMRRRQTQTSLRYA